MLKSKWRRFLLFIPLPLFLCLVNIFGDAGNRFHDPIDDMIDEMLEGKAAYVSTGNMKEREFRYKYITRMPEDMSCLIVGGSTIMCVKSEDVGEEKFMNLGVSGGGILDAMWQLALMKQHNKDKNLHRIILGVSEYWLNSKMFDIRSRPLVKEINDMIDIIGVKNITVSFEEQYNLALLNEINANPLFSLAYFQANINFIIGSVARKKSNGSIFTGGWAGYHYMPDGSLVYGSHVIDWDEKYLKQEAVKYDIQRFTRDIDFEAQELFTKFIEYLLSQNIKVDLYLVPIAPALWDALPRKKYPFLYELEEYLYKIADKYSLRLIGSYNPHKSEIPNSDFYDSRHIRREYISKYFNLK